MDIIFVIIYFDKLYFYIDKDTRIQGYTDTGI